MAEYYDITRTPQERHDRQPVPRKMGAYLSEPITKKISSDEVGKNVAYGASSMQGWRISQEVSGKSFRGGSSGGRARAFTASLPRFGEFTHQPACFAGYSIHACDRLPRGRAHPRQRIFNAECCAAAEWPTTPDNSGHSHATIHALRR